jgi:hypothetical protein
MKKEKYNNKEKEKEEKEKEKNKKNEKVKASVQGSSPWRRFSSPWTTSTRTRRCSPTSASASSSGGINSNVSFPLLLLSYEHLIVFIEHMTPETTYNVL